jgi:hypothetical protein
MQVRKKGGGKEVIKKGSLQPHSLHTLSLVALAYGMNIVVCMLLQYMIYTVDRYNGFFGLFFWEVEITLPHSVYANILLLGGVDPFPSNRIDLQIP